jgi:hypothetical protein
VGTKATIGEIILVRQYNIPLALVLDSILHLVRFMLASMADPQVPLIGGTGCMTRGTSHR